MAMRSGEWARARRLLTAVPSRLRSAIGVALRQEAQRLRSTIVEGITNQSPGGEAIRAPSELTLAARQLKGINGTKALLVRGDLRNSITVVIDDTTAFVGIPRAARSADGQSLVDLAELHEFGGPPVIIPLTPKMRRFLFAMLRRAGKTATGGSGRGVIVVQVPARPFLRPAFEKYRQGAGRRFLQRVGHELGLGSGVE